MKNEELMNELRYTCIYTCIIFFMYMYTHVGTYSSSSECSFVVLEVSSVLDSSGGGG